LAGICWLVDENNAIARRLLHVRVDSRVSDSEPEHSISISVRCVSDRLSETLNGGTQKAMKQKMMNWMEGDL